MDQPPGTTVAGGPQGLSRRFALAEGVTFQPMGEDQDTVVLALAQGQLFTCNDSTTDFLGAVQEGLTLGQAAQRLVETYGIDSATAEIDLLELAGTLLAEGLIVELD